MAKPLLLFTIYFSILYPLQRHWLKMAPELEVVDLVRGGAKTTSLLGAFGLSLKETRLTAWLGYLLAEQPEPLLSLFGFRGRVHAIRLETRHDEGRSDILVETHLGVGLIEAKVDATDAGLQSLRYPAQWRAVLALAPERAFAGVHYVHWQKLANRLQVISNKATPTYKFLVSQFILYLKEHQMIKNTESVEIYAREINEPVTLALFMQGHMYGCKYEKGNKLASAKYFAPHFGARLALKQPGIFQGVSYVAKIQDVIYAEKWKELMDEICAKRGRGWLNSHEDLLKKLHQRKDWHWGSVTPRSFLLLGEPRLAFNPPIQKKRLQKGYGWLSRRFFCFDDFFAAWGH